MAISHPDAGRPHTPEHRLWLLRKQSHTCEATVRASRLGTELLVYWDRRLLWSQVCPDGRSVGELAAERREDLLARGWTLDPSDTDEVPIRS